MTTEELKEELAAREHLRWAHWQEYLHSTCRPNHPGEDGLVIPGELVVRWEIQIRTPYEQLSELEKQSDRNQVEHYWPLIEEYIRSQTAYLGDSSGKRYTVYKGMAPLFLDEPSSLPMPLYHTDDVRAALQYRDEMVAAHHWALFIWDRVTKETIGTLG